MRLHLFEFEDLSWFPGRIREYMTDHLAFMAQIGAPVYANVARRIADGMRRLEIARVLELGAGGAGPSAVLAKALRAEQPELRYVLSDLHPNLRAWELRRHGEPSLEWSEAPVDAIASPPAPGEYRILCSCFHHFEPGSARRVLERAFRARAPIAVIEVVERSALGVVGVVLGSALVPIVAPFLRPFSVGRLFFTYLVPVVPLCVLWDGLVSCLRSYPPAELEALVAELQSDDYLWEVGRMPATRGPGRVTYLLGEPVLASLTETAVQPARASHSPL